MAAHFGSLLSSATKRAAVLNSGREEVRRGMCSLSYQSALVKREYRERREKRGKGREESDSAVQSTQDGRGSV
jgi:hypothetical protein